MSNKNIKNQSNQNNKNNQTNMQGNTQAIASNDARDHATGRAIPNQTHVKEAKDFVDQNHK